MNKFSLIIFLSFFSCPLFSQILLSPNFHLGDTTQTIILTTYRGDRFVGNLIQWQADTLHFKIRNEVKIQLPLFTIESIWVEDAGPLPPPNGVNRGIFTVVAEDSSEIHIGRLKLVEKRQLKFHPENKGVQFFKLDEVQHVTFTPSPIGHVNTFRLKREGKKDKVVQFINYQDSVLTVRENGEIKKYNQYEKVSLYYIKPRMQMRGHQRQLMTSPTGFNLKARESIYRNSMLAYNEVAIGLTNNFSIGAGAAGLLPFLSARLSFSPHKLIHLSAGGMWLPVDERDGRAWHMAASFGTPDFFINIARVKYIGNIYEEPNDFQSTTIGGSFRIGRRTSFFSEYAMVDQEPFYFFGTLEGRLNLFSWGVRWFQKHSSISVGFMAVGPMSNFCPGCGEEFYQPYPAFSADIFLNKKKK